MKKQFLITSIPFLLALISFVCLSNAQVVNFESPKYKVQTNLDEGKLHPLSTSLISQFNKLSPNGAEIIDVSGNQKLRINSGSSNNSRGWVKDSVNTTLSGNDIVRSVDINIGTAGSAGRIIAGLFANNYGSSGSTNVGDDNKNSIVHVNFYSKNKTLGIRRQGVSGLESFNGTRWVSRNAFISGGWSPSKNYTIRLSYADLTNEVSFIVLEEGSVRAKDTFKTSKLAAGFTTARFIVGEPFNNSGKDWVFDLDNISTVPVQK